MSDVVEVSVALLRKFADFTKKLTPEQLAAVAAGELKFTLEGTKKPATKSAIVDVEAVSTYLAGSTTREDAVSYVDGLALSLANLKQLAKELGAAIVGATTKVQVRDRIVEHTVGYRLNSQTIRSGSWKD